MQRNLFFRLLNVSENFRLLHEQGKLAAFSRTLLFLSFETGVAHLNRNRSPELLIYTTHFCFMMKTRKANICGNLKLLRVFKEKMQRALKGESGSGCASCSLKHTHNTFWETGCIIYVTCTFM